METNKLNGSNGTDGRNKMEALKVMETIELNAVYVINPMQVTKIKHI